MNCPNCGAEMSRDPFSGSRWESGADFVCPRCDGSEELRRPWHPALTFLRDMAILLAAVLLIAWLMTGLDSALDALRR
jgi:hypothetical protein